jgi:V8-like Glu-specific endopeptidase
MNHKGWAALATSILAAAVVGLLLTAFTQAPRPYDYGVLQLQITTPGGTIGGSGVAIGPRLIVTAAHVAVAGPTFEMKNARIAVQPGHVGWAIERLDIGVIEPTVPVDEIRELSCQDPNPGEPITIVGYPNIGGFLPTGAVITKGTVASKVQRDPEDGSVFIILDAKVQPGNSGGPVFDAQGRVVGIAVAMFGYYLGPPPAKGERDRRPFVGNGYSMMVPGSVLCRQLGRA